MGTNIEVALKKTEPVAVAFIACKGPYDQLPQAFGRLFGWVQQNGYTPAGLPQGVYFNSPTEVSPEELLWELRCPIAGKVAPRGPDEQGLGVKEVEAMEVAATLHKGPYHEVGATYAALAAWIAENGYQIIGPAAEVYLNVPETTPPEELLTEVRFPIKKS